MPESRDQQRARQLRERAGTPAAGADGEPTRQVAALGYEQGRDHAPRLLARGAGHTADKILELAEAHGVPVTEDPTLVSILGAIDVGAEVPPDLYGVIAEVLAWAYRADTAAATSKAIQSRRAA